MHFVAICTLAWLLMLVGCDGLGTKASDSQLDINGSRVASVPYAPDGSVVLEVGFDETSSIEVQEAAVDNGPWYVWPANQDTLVISQAGPDVWDASCGLYETTAAMDGTKLTLRLGRKLEPSAEDQQVLTFVWDDIVEKWLFDGGSGSLILAVKTPYTKGCFLVAAHKRLVRIDK